MTHPLTRPLTLTTAAALLLTCGFLSACFGSHFGLYAPGFHGAFSRNFTVDKATLVNTGSGRYWTLTPGHRATYKNKDGETLTITNLAETKLIDGVMTRIVEEREEKNGTPTEISRNFMALDPANGNIYYFGEESQTYKNGKPSDTKGSWKSGEKDARFGLLVPGAAKVGDKSYQEIAPGIAMDRFEVVGIDEKITVPAGTFEHCLHIVETTPLEKNKTNKWYAPGVGLVKDDEFELAEMPRK